MAPEGPPSGPGAAPGLVQGPSRVGVNPRGAATQGGLGGEDENNPKPVQCQFGSLEPRGTNRR